ncbi:hypothetical protein FISHEDRAFT_45025 [Fistulina hepatica ATCC 64428]|uniref:DUF6589 domain-containing protein n=1 Tax=Fistulina hepatica ATCC 64428 TaxID=1128425 RepID=A0A0D7AA32_9AGAR|nr:hypothetical protein FISHEDRAFT_45025 [Fistulina hepatica ATCC 64428]
MSLLICLCLSFCRDIMRDNHLVNVAGLPGHFMAVDFNCEHHIGYIKGHATRKGIYGQSDYLRNVAAISNQFMAMSRTVANNLDSGYCSRYHQDVDTSALVWTVARKLRETGAQHFDPERRVFPLRKDLLHTCFQTTESTSLSVFNKRVRENGLSLELEVDEITPVELIEKDNEALL